MASLATYEYARARLAVLKWGLYDAEAALRLYRDHLPDAIDGPVTSTLAGEADQWIAALDNAQYAIDVYWERYLDERIAELEAESQ